MKKTNQKNLLVSCGIILMTIIACNKPHTEEELSNYIKKENTYYKLNSAIVFYDSLSPDQTMFSLGIHSEDVDQNMIVFDYLLLQNTFELQSGTYSYKKELRIHEFEANKFHDVLLRCKSPVMNSVTHPITQGILLVAKTSTNVYEVKANLIMDGKNLEVQFKGPVQHIKAW